MMDNSKKVTGGNKLSEALSKAKEDFKHASGVEKAQAVTDFVEQLNRSGIKAGALKPGGQAADFSLKNAIGETVTLSEELKKGPVIITWYRGGWCPYCNLALNYMQQYLSDFKAAGAILLAITPEKPDNSLSTKERHELKFEVLSDEENEVARKYGGVHDLSEKIKGFYLERGVGEHYAHELNVFPVPATYVIDQDFVVRYAFVESDYRMRAEPEDILDVLNSIKKSNF